MSRLAALRTPVLIAVLATASGGLVLHRRVAEPAPFVRQPLGELLPNVLVDPATGGRIYLRDLIGRHPALVYVFSAAQCAGCSNLALEFDIVRRAHPGLRTVLIGSGAPAAEFREAFATMGVTGSAVVDESRALLRALSIRQEPIVLLTDSTGRIVFVDPRTPSQAAQYPMGRVLTDIQGVLGTRAVAVTR